LDPQDFGFLDPHPDAGKNMQGVTFQPKTAKKTPFILLNPKSELLKKRDYKNFLISE